MRDEQGTGDMRAVMISAFDAPPAIVEVDARDPGTSDVVVRVQAAGVCRSDLSAARGQYAFSLPMVLGHEGTGVVEAIGSRVTEFAVGDRVIASWVPACGRCFQCVRGRTHLCERQGEVGQVPRVDWDGERGIAMSGLGTMAEFMTVDEASLVKVDTLLPPEQLVLIGCTVTTGVGAVLWTAGVTPGASVAIFGCGGVGLSIVQGAAIAGAAQIIAVDPVALKRRAAQQYGATAAIDPSTGSAVEQILELTSGRGAEFTFEAVGRTTTMRDAFDAVCRGGIVTFVGALPASAALTLPANAARASGKQIRGSNYGSAQVRRDMPRIIALAEAGRLDLGTMVSRQLPLDGIGSAFESMESGDAIRSILVPSLAAVAR